MPELAYDHFMLPATPRNERRILGGAVRRIRELKQVTQAELATKAAEHTARGTLHFAYLSNIEAGRKQPSLEVMAALANALNVDLDDISYMANIYVITEDAA